MTTLLIVLGIIILILTILFIVGLNQDWGTDALFGITDVLFIFIFGIVLGESATKEYPTSEYKQEIRYEITIINNDTICDTIYSFIKK